MEAQRKEINLSLQVVADLKATVFIGSMSIRPGFTHTSKLFVSPLSTTFTVNTTTKWSTIQCNEKLYSFKHSVPCKEALRRQVLFLNLFIRSDDFSKKNEVGTFHSIQCDQIG